MNAWQPSRRECLLALFLLMGCFSAQNTWAAELVWTGGAGDSWQTPENWAPITVPGEEPIQRIPQDGDTVVIADPSHGGFVGGELPRLAGLEIANGMYLTASGNLADVRIELASAVLGGNLQVFGASEIDVTGDGGTIASERLLEQSPAPGFQMEGGSIHVVEGARLTFSDVGNQDGWHKLRDVSLHLERGTTLVTSSWNRVELEGVDVVFPEETRSVTIQLSYLSNLTISANRFGADASPGRFDGTILMNGARLTLTTPGGWTLGGRLELDNNRSTTISGSPLTIDSIGLDDGIFLSTGDFNDTTINADLILTENARIDFGAFLPVLKLHGDVTNFRSELGVGDGQFRFAGDVTRFAVPTTLMVGGVFDRGMIVLDADLTIDDNPDFDGTPCTLIINPDARFTGDGAIFVDGILQLLGGAVVDVPIVNRGAVELSAPIERQRTVQHYLQTEDATLTIRSSSLGPISLLYAENGAELDGRLQIETFGADVRHIELLAAGGDGITGRFSDYDLRPPDDGFWKVTYGATSVTLDVVDVLQGDYNGNGLVEQADLDLVLSNWGTTAATSPEGWNHDAPAGIIDQDELDRVLLGWGAQAIKPREGAAAMPVPEPRSAILVLLALGAALTCKAARAWHRVAPEGRHSFSRVV